MEAASTFTSTAYGRAYERPAGNRLRAAASAVLPCSSQRRRPRRESPRYPPRARRPGDPKCLKSHPGRSRPAPNGPPPRPQPLYGSEAVSDRDEERRTRSEQTGDILLRHAAASSICGLVAGVYPVRITVPRTVVKADRACRPVYSCRGCNANVGTRRRSSCFNTGRGPVRRTLCRRRRDARQVRGV